MLGHIKLSVSSFRHKLESECVELSPGSEAEWQDWGPEKGTGGHVNNNRYRWVDRR